jgi:signal transduction histidine kinase
LTRATGEPQTVETLVESGARLFRSDAICVFVWDFGSDTLRPQLQSGLVGDRAAEFERLQLRRGVSSRWDRLLDGEVAWLPFVRDPNDPLRRLRRGWRSAYALALRHAGRTHGVACLLYSDTQRAFSDEDEALLAWSDLAGMAINLAQLAEHERTAARNAIELATSLYDPTALWELREVLGSLCRRLLASLHMRAVAVVLRDARKRTIRIAGLAGSAADFAALAQNREFPDVLPAGFPARGYIVVSSRFAADLLPLDPERDQLGRMLCVPIVREGEMLGILAVVAQRADAVFGREQIDLARAFADQALVAIETARFYRREQESAQRTRVLLEIATVTPEPFDAHRYLDYVASRAREVLEARVCSIWLWGNDGRALVMAARSEVGTPTRSRRNLRAPRIHPASLVPWEELSGRAVIRTGFAGRSRLLAHVGRGQALLAAIQAGSRLLGVVVVTRPANLAPYTEAHALTLSGVAEVAALRLQQHGLLQQVAERERELARHRERERIARDLHDTALQSLTGIGLQIAALQRHDRPVAGAELSRLQDAVQSQFETVLGFLERLRSPGPEAVDLQAEIDATIGEIERRSGLRVHRRYHADDPVAGALAHDVLLFVREGLANVEKHAGVRQAWVSITARNGQIDVRISDKGRGFPAATLAGRYVREECLPWSIRQRAASLGGALRIRSQPDKGTALVVRLPCSKDSTTGRTTIEGTAG